MSRRDNLKVHSVAEHSAPQDGVVSAFKAELDRATSETSQTAALLDFQQAKKSDEETSVFTNRGKPEPLTCRKSKQPKLTRVAFRVSRLMEFCTKRELQNQTGHSLPPA